MPRRIHHIDIGSAQVRTTWRNLVDERTDATGEGVEWMSRLIEKAGGRDKLAVQLSGTSDKRSRAYKSQRDYISRVLRGGRGIGKAKTQTLSGQARKMTADKIRSQSAAKVKIAATWKMSKTEWSGAAFADFTGEDRESLASLIEIGDADAILDMVASKYGEDFAANVWDVLDFEGIEFE